MTMMMVVVVVVAIVVGGDEDGYESNINIVFVNFRV